MRLQSRQEAARHVLSEITIMLLDRFRAASEKELERLLYAECNPEFGQHLGQATAAQQFAVDEHAIAIKDDEFEPAAVHPDIRSYTHALSNSSPGPHSLGAQVSPPLVIHVDAHRSEQHQALDDLLVVDADAEDRHAVVHHAHNHGADPGAADAPDAAIGRGAADEAGGDDIELEAKAGFRGRGVQPRRED